MISKFRLALSFLTIFPVGKMNNISEDAWAESTLLYPVCGYIIGLITITPIFLLNYFFTISPLLLAAITVALLALITGALHLDGFADVCDGFFCPTGSKERRLEIMHDPHIGTFGVVGLIILLLIKFVSFFVLIRNGEFLSIGAIVVLARFSMVLLAATSTYPTEKGIGKFIVGKISKLTLLLSFILILPCCFSIRILITAGIMLCIIFILKLASNKLIGGVTGDVLGACSEITETIGLLTLTIMT